MQGFWPPRLWPQPRQVQAQELRESERLFGGLGAGALGFGFAAFVGFATSGNAVLRKKNDATFLEIGALLNHFLNERIGRGVLGRSNTIRSKRSAGEMYPLQ